MPCRAVGTRVSRLPVIILSGGVTGLGVLRAFARQGIPAYVYATAACRSHPALALVSRAARHRRSITVLPRRASRCSRRCSRTRSCTAPFCARAATTGTGSSRSLPNVRAGLRQHGTVAALRSRSCRTRATWRCCCRRSACRCRTRCRSTAARDIAELPPSNDTFYFLKPTRLAELPRAFRHQGHPRAVPQTRPGAAST